MERANSMTHFVYNKRKYWAFEDAKTQLLKDIGDQDIVSVDEAMPCAIYRTPTRVYEIERKEGL